jgi:uncharacterized protein (TIRG00374 family)
LENKPPQPELAANRIRMYALLAVILFLFVISGFLLVYLLRDVDWTLVRQTDPEVLLLILGLTILFTLAYTLLVCTLVRSSGYATTLWQAYLVLTASLSANYITPVKVGIPLRIYLYRTSMEIPITSGTVLVAVEALVGTLAPAFIAVAGIALLFPSVGLMMPLILIVLLLLGLFFVLRVKTARFEPFLQRLPLSNFTIRATHFLERIQLGLRVIPPAAILGVVLLDLLMIGLQTVRLWLILNVFGRAPSLPSLFAVYTISFTAGNLSMIPMGLGVRDASFTLLLAQLNVPYEIALSATVIERVFATGWPLFLGLISANILGISRLLKRPESLDVTHSDVNHD